MPKPPSKPTRMPAFNAVEQPQQQAAFMTTEQAVAINEEFNAMQNMERYELLRRGYLTVAELDDEELRSGIIRSKDGRLLKKKQDIPPDLLKLIEIEHMKRMNDRLRAEADRSLDVMVEVRDDVTAEPADRFKAAQYLFERVVGKTVDKTEVTITKAPWEEVFEGLAQTTRQHAAALRNQNAGQLAGATDQPIDAEFVEVPEASPYGYIQVPDQPPNPTGQQYTTQQPAPTQHPNWQSQPNHPTPAGPPNWQQATQQPRQSAQPGATPQPSQAADDGAAAIDDPGVAIAEPSYADDVPDLRHGAITVMENRVVPAEEFAPIGSEDNPYPLYSAPNHWHPRNSMSTAPPPEYIPPQAQEQYADASTALSNALRDRRLTAGELAEKRAVARNMRKGAKEQRTKIAPEGIARTQAKKYRIVARALGLDANPPLNIRAAEQDQGDDTAVVNFRAETPRQAND